MEVIIKYVKKEEKRAKTLLKDFKQLHTDFGGFPECAKAKLLLNIKKKDEVM